MSVRSILSFTQKPSQSLVNVTPWTRLLVETNEAPLHGHRIAETVVLRKGVNAVGIITTIVIEQLSQDTSDVERCLCACTWWLVREPFSAGKLPVALRLHTCVSLPPDLARVCTVTFLHLQHRGGKPHYYQHQAQSVVDLAPLRQQLGHVEDLEVVLCAPFRGELLQLENGALLTHGMHQHLRRLRLSHVHVTELSLSPCTALESLNVAYCGALERLSLVGAVAAPQLPLSVLDVSHTRLSSLSELRYCPSLECLTASSCRHLTDFTVLPLLTRLVKVYLDYTSFDNLGLVANLRRLEVLEVGGCRGILDLSPLSRLFALRELSIAQTAITSLESLVSCISLEVIDATGCPDLIVVDGSLHSLSHLREVYFEGAQTRSANFLRGCTSLQVVHLNGCADLSDITALAGAVALTVIDVSDTAVTDLAPLESCVHLQSMNMSGCNALADVSSFQCPQSIERVDAENTCLANVDFLRTCTFLTYVNFESSSVLSDITALKTAIHLRDAIFAHTAISTLDSLCECRELKYVSIENCVGITDLHGLSNAVGLQTLFASHTGLRNLNDLRHCVCLDYVDVSYCSNLTDIDALRYCGATLTHLFMEDSPVDTLDCVSAFTNLKLTDMTDPHQGVRVT